MNVAHEDRRQFPFSASLAIVAGDHAPREYRWLVEDNAVQAEVLTARGQWRPVRDPERLRQLLAITSAASATDAHNVIPDAGTAARSGDRP